MNVFFERLLITHLNVILNLLKNKINKYDIELILLLFIIKY